MALDRATRRAIARYGPTVNHLARQRYGVSGQTLLAKLIIGESGGDKNAVSGAGARGRTQFMPGSRKIAIDKYGVDPWRSADEAVHAAALHLRGKINGSKGLEGYNPGMASYPKYILGQKAPSDLPRQHGLSKTGRNVGGSQNPQVVVNQQGTQFDAGQVTALASLLTQKPQRPSGSIPALPEYAAKPVMAAQPINAGSSRGSKTDLDSLLSAVQTPAADLPATSTSVTTRGGAQGAKGGGKLRVVTFDGKPVRSDFAKQLRWARRHGWKGKVTSGFRTKAEQMAAAKGFGLQHYGPKGPLGSNHVVGHRGAVDVSDPDTLDQLLKRYPGKRTLIRGMADDPVHFSPTGN